METYKENYFASRLAATIAEEREKGLIGVRVFAFEGDNATDETIARDVLALHDDAMAGRCEDITNGSW